MNTVKNGDLVIIGQELGVAEQYLGEDDSTYIEEGKLLAAITGNVHLDETKRLVRINGQNEEKRKIPKPGDMVTGTIYSIRRNSVGAMIETLNNKVVVDIGLVGNIHVSNVSKTYIDKLDDVFEKTDIIRAQVIRQDGKEFQISTSGSDLGVIKSQCKYCGNIMIRKGRNQVICPFCSNVQRKEMANDYGTFEVKLEF